MGFTPPRKVYVLDFTDTELDGLIVRTVSMSTDAFLELLQLIQDVKGNLDAIHILAPKFIAVVRSWNLEAEIEDDEGSTIKVPVPLSVAGLLTLEIKQTMMVLDAWQSVMVGVSPPLEQPSSDGAPSPVESLPMELLSDSRAS